MLFLVAALALASSQAPVAAVNPCEDPTRAAVTTLAAGEAFRLAFTASNTVGSVDETGKPILIPMPVDIYKVTIDGVQQPWPGPLETFAPANPVADWCFQTPRTLALPVGAHKVQVSLLAGINGSESPLTPPVAITVTPPVAVDNCATPFGVDAVAVFVTRWERTTGLPGSRMRVNYTLASKWPIVEIVAKLNGAPVGRLLGSDLTADGGLWFSQPALGSYKLTVQARNVVGCTREVFAPADLVLR